jgi:dsRNA-specific ribonuclease
MHRTEGVMAWTTIDWPKRYDRHGVSLGMWRLAVGDCLKSLNLYHTPRHHLYEQAFTHASYGNKHTVPHNEVFEFRGDAVLELILTEQAVMNYPFAREGFLAPLRSKMVCNERLAEFGAKFKFDHYLLSECREISEKTMASTVESVFGACMTDRGYDGCVELAKHMGLMNAINVNGRIL